MANGGAVDAGTQLAMQGAMEMERGSARAWSAGATAGVQAAYMQSAMQKGAMAAENIRNRYFKKEFEQIQEMRIQPLQDRLKAAQELRNNTLMMTTMPVARPRSTPMAAAPMAWRSWGLVRKADPRSRPRPRLQFRLVRLKKVSRRLRWSSSRRSRLWLLRSSGIS